MSSGARFLGIGTHHKTGTVWMRRTFRRYADAAGIPVVRLNGPDKLSELPTKGPALCVNWSSEFPRAFFDHPGARAIHVIRDPRDVLLSGQRYHLTAKTGNEKWLGKPLKELQGRTYQEAIRALPDRVSQLLFEMRGKHARTVTEMLSWPYGHPHAVDLRYEDLIEDTDCAVFRAAIERAAVVGFDTDGLVEEYWRHALFGGQSDAGARRGLVAAHVKSGRAGQWRDALPREVAEIYAEDYGPALVQLGYAEDDSWVDLCRPEAEIAA
ncbi:sulfotransferase domain-containing protein [Histidinibacterium aquaticum]|uniref:Sulfotransferase domain-containing protein n=1 Tax=Histidinibacterium aquaticum TaxID=2613962 RepID=A0A5J5GMP2_9RHOB|nr:sulfotransferase domain-containing protein [Histidinibacterium aquaticum]KAA9009327.1 sulfotransferase domain-containing protein [Histidinibacterium aquaticum]